MSPTSALPQPHSLVAGSLVLLRKLIFELSRDGRQLRLGTRERLTVAETPNPIDPPRPPLRRCGGRQCLRHDDVRFRHRRESKIGRQHADDHAARGAQLNRTRQRLWVRSELRAPEVLADDHHGRSALPRVLLVQQSAKRGLHAQRLERVRRGDGSLDTQWLPVRCRTWTEIR